MSIMISVEGVGGSGKSSLVKRIGDWLRERQIPHLLTFEPGGTPAANALRKLCREGIPDAEPLTPMAEVLLFNAARAQHVETIVKPALKAGTVVVTDRYYQTTMAYQGVIGGESLYTIGKIHHDAIGLYPDLTLVMCGDEEVFMNRIHPGEKLTDKFDNWKIAQFERAQQYFESLVNDDTTGKFFGVNADKSQDEVFEQVRPVLESLMKRIGK